MKNIKFITATVLAIGLTLTVFMEPADAQRRRGRSYRRSNNAPILEFDLLVENEQGLIEDSKPEDETTGLFIGAIENVFADDFVFDEEIFATFAEFEQGNFSAELVNNNQVVYTIIGPSETEFSFDPVRIPLEDGSPDLGFVNDISTIVNSDEEIIPRAFEQTEFLNFPNLDLDPEFDPPDELEIDPIGATSSIPEPTSTISLFVIGGLAAGVLKKRQNHAK